MNDELGYLIIERLDLSKSSRDVIAIGAKVILNSSSQSNVAKDGVKGSIVDQISKRATRDLNARGGKGLKIWQPGKAPIDADGFWKVYNYVFGPIGYWTLYPRDVAQLTKSYVEAEAKEMDQVSCTHFVMYVRSRFS